MELFSTQREFSAYGPSHGAVLGVFVIGSAAFVWIGRRQTESQARVLGRVLAVLILAVIGVALVYKLIRSTIDDGERLASKRAEICILRVAHRTEAGMFLRHRPDRRIQRVAPCCSIVSQSLRHVSGPIRGRACSVGAGGRGHRSPRATADHRG